MPDHPFDLTGKVSLVTGANSGIGLGFARGLARAGSDVVIWGRRADRNAAAAETLRAFGTRVATDAVDVTDAAAVDSAMTRAVAGMGRIDVVVANAGVATPVPFVEMNDHAYRALLDVNLDGAVFTLRAAARHMLAGKRGGSLIVCGSGSIFQGVPTLGHYAVAKGALAALAKTLAVELGPHGIRCNVIAPGFIETGMTFADPQIGAALAAMVAERTPLGRAGRPEDLEGAVVYLASDAARHHTGDTLVIDGGKLVTN